eukprot:122820-Karenia_brevis.AAC.1
MLDVYHLCGTRPWALGRRRTPLRHHCDATATPLRHHFDTTTTPPQHRYDTAVTLFVIIWGSKYDHRGLNK